MPDAHQLPGRLRSPTANSPAQNRAQRSRAKRPPEGAIPQGPARPPRCALAPLPGWRAGEPVGAPDTGGGAGRGRRKGFQASSLTRSGSPRWGVFHSDSPQLFSSVHFSSGARSCPTLCDPMNRSAPGLPVHHQLPESTQTHAH